MIIMIIIIIIIIIIKAYKKKTETKPRQLANVLNYIYKVNSSNQVDWS